MTDETEIEEAPVPSGKPKRKARRAYRARAPRKAAASAVDIVAVASSPELQAIIAAAVQAATAGLLAQIEERREVHGTKPAPSSDLALAQEMGKAMANQVAALADQTSKVKRVAPDELVKREAARARMEFLIIDYHSQGLRPVYELTAAQYLEERLIAPTYTDRNHRLQKTRIEWSRCPNEQMQPINAEAKEIYTAFIESIGGPTVNRSFQSKSEDTGLSVLHEPTGGGVVPMVGKPRNPELRILGDHQDGEIIETAILGTIAAKARQVA